MSKKVKMALGVAAAIAIPYFAPTIAGNLGMSGILGSTLVGAGGGALGANLTGGDWRKGAALGALGGGIRGYQAGMPGATGTTTAPADVAGTTAAPTGIAGTSTGVPGVTGTSAALPPTDASLAGLDFSSPYAAEFGTSIPTETGFFSGLGETLGGPSVYVPAGISLASGYMGEKRAEEAEAAQQAEIRRQQQQQEAVFARQQALAESLAQQAEATNPEYFGLQSARRAQAAGAMATRAAEEAAPFYKPGLRMAEKRRGELATARGTGTAYDVGYGTGVEAKRGLTESAIRSMPQAPSSGLASFYGTQAAGQRQAGMDVGRLFGDIYSRYDQAQQRRLDEERNRMLDQQLGRMS